jgi:hypothetical protein
MGTWDSTWLTLTLKAIIANSAKEKKKGEKKQYTNTTCKFSTKIVICQDVWTGQNAINRIRLVSCIRYALFQTLATGELCQSMYPCVSGRGGNNGL